MRIYGIAEELETLSTERLNQEIKNMYAQVNWLHEDSKYADHGAYGQDQYRISKFYEDIRVLEHIVLQRTEMEA